MILTAKRQTELLSKLDDFLSSIAIQAVEARNKQGNPDAVFDLIASIEGDIEHVKKINTILAVNEDNVGGGR